MAESWMILSVAGSNPVVSVSSITYGVEHGQDNTEEVRLEHDLLLKKKEKIPM